MLLQYFYDKSGKIIYWKLLCKEEKHMIFYLTQKMGQN